MATKEAKLWKRINQLQKGRKNWHLTRIESSTINGIPDVYGCIEGRSFWLELKATNAKNCGLSKFQVNWHLNHQQAGGIVRILNVHASQPVAHAPPSRRPDGSWSVIYKDRIPRFFPGLLQMLQA